MEIANEMKVLIYHTKLRWVVNISVAVCLPMASNHSLGIARKKEMENQFFIITNDSKKLWRWRKFDHHYKKFYKLN
jgi:hypothetical protein